MAIDLSAGVALPQTGPEGTMMTFSVDYQFTQGEPHPSATFFWVIERAKGAPAKIAVRLKSKDNLSTVFVTGWRPEQGPFQSHIQDAAGRRISDVVPLVMTGAP